MVVALFGWFMFDCCVLVGGLWVFHWFARCGYLVYGFWIWLMRVPFFRCWLLRLGWLFDFCCLWCLRSGFLVVLFVLAVWF